MSMQSPLDSSSSTPRHGTVLESVEGLRELLIRSQTAQEKAPEQLTGSQDDAVRFRPLMRPTTALLSVFDDGGESGDLVRIRKSPFVIGRTDGDLSIPHDNLISTKHAEISRRSENGQWAWYLKDLNSTNGTFVRVTASVLRAGQILLIGGKRYQFMVGEPATDKPARENQTMQWQQLSAETILRMQPALVELDREQNGQRYPLGSSESWIGRNPAGCNVVLDDPMVSEKHARIYCDTRGRWCVENGKSVNGVWAQIEEIPLGNGGYFQCGEQRFAIRVI